MQAANAGLEAAFTREKTIMAQVQASAQVTIQELQNKIEEVKAQTRKEDEQHFEKRLAELKKKIAEDYSRKAEAKLIQIQ